MSRPRHRLTRWLLLGAVLVLALGSLRLLGTRLAYEWQGLSIADTAIYWTVGRGITLGLSPYSDLFESKPPGIFLLSALSLWLGDSFALTHRAQALALALLPTALLAWTWKRAAATATDRRWLILGAVLMATVLLTLFTAERAGEVQTESFGAAAAVGYLCLLTSSGKPTRLRDLAGGLLLLAACGMKEPFLLTIVAGMLILEPGRQAWRAFLGHLAVAAAVGVGVLALCGWLRPFSQVYLPEMLLRHIHQGAPLWQRSLWLSRTFIDLAVFSPWIAALVVGAALFWLPQLVERRGLGRGLGEWLLRFGGAALLVGMAHGLGGEYYNHHFAFAVPAYSALAMLGVAEATDSPAPPWVRIAGWAALLLAAVGVLRLPPGELGLELKNDQLAVASMKQRAEVIDEMLVRCERSRYLFIGANGRQPYAFTRHPPLGPLFFQYDKWLDARHAKFQQAFRAALAEADILLVDEWRLGELTPWAQAYVAEEFTEEPPGCAASLPLQTVQPASFRFRREWQ